jgi:ABC-type Na+ efflux pump permease subunit
VEKGGRHMSQSENKINVEEARENLQDALSLLIILENDLSTQQADEIYLRAVRVIHNLLRDVQAELTG